MLGRRPLSVGPPRVQPEPHVVVGVRSPEAVASVGSLPAVSLRVADGARTVEVSGAFRDPDDDDLTFAASSSEEAVATVSVSGSMLEVTPESGGAATITVTATDVDGSNTTATQRFEATVGNQAPVAVGRISPLSLRVEAGPESVEVSGAFRDPDDDMLAYEATSSATPVATVSVSGSEVR